jgi:hypothetical protein
MMNKYNYIPNAIALLAVASMIFSSPNMLVVNVYASTPDEEAPRTDVRPMPICEDPANAELPECQPEGTTTEPPRTDVRPMPSGEEEVPPTVDCEVEPNNPVCEDPGVEAEPPREETPPADPNAGNTGNAAPNAGNAGNTGNVGTPTGDLNAGNTGNAAPNAGNAGNTGNVGTPTGDPNAGNTGNAAPNAGNTGNVGTPTPPEAGDETEPFIPDEPPIEETEQTPPVEDDTLFAGPLVPQEEPPTEETIPEPPTEEPLAEEVPPTQDPCLVDPTLPDCQPVDGPAPEVELNCEAQGLVEEDGQCVMP